MNVSNTFTVETSSFIRSRDCLHLYSNPSSNLGTQFFVDDLVIEKIDDKLCAFFDKLSKNPEERPLEETVQGSSAVTDEIELMKSNNAADEDTIDVDIDD